MKTKTIVIIFLVSILFLVFFAKSIYASSGDDAIGAADAFLNKGASVGTVLGEEKLQETSKFLNRVLISIGIVIMFAVGTIIGMQFMLSSAEGKAKVKQALIPYTIGCAIILGGFTIWSIFVDFGQNTSPTSYSQTTASMRRDYEAGAAAARQWYMDNIYYQGWPTTGAPYVDIPNKIAEEINRPTVNFREIKISSATECKRGYTETLTILMEDQKRGMDLAISWIEGQGFNDFYEAIDKINGQVNNASSVGDQYTVAFGYKGILTMISARYEGMKWADAFVYGYINGYYREYEVEGASYIALEAGRAFREKTYRDGNYIPFPSNDFMYGYVRFLETVERKHATYIIEHPYEHGGDLRPGDDEYVAECRRYTTPKNETTEIALSNMQYMLGTLTDGDYTGGIDQIQ